MTHPCIRALWLGLLCLAAWPVTARAQDGGGMTVWPRGDGGSVFFPLYEIGSIIFEPCDEIIVRLRDGTERRFDVARYGTLKFVPCDDNPRGARMPDAAAPGEEASIASGLDVTLFPNPTSSSLMIQIESDRAGLASVEVYDLAGALVWSRGGVEIGAGATRVSWSGTNAAGERVNSGTYVIRVVASGRVSTQSVSVTK